MELLLKTKTLVLVAITGVILLLVQCQQSTDYKSTSTKDSTSCVKTNSLNPNGDSELAILMRNMYDSLLAVNTLIKSGGVPTKFPEEFKKIHTATPSDANTKFLQFDAFATDYINSLQLLYTSPKKELPNNYNMLVQKCANCHEASCPGPLKKINKLKLVN